ncbi:MAG: 5'/3'-nucleotidase SurE [Deltaproteobacteria bacterium]|nr:5'/3'-nucleotidase SurE [Deltaproteobacteria bacterium]
MLILLTNDDGVYAPGLRALNQALLHAGHEVFVAAPETEQSAVGHAITLVDPIRVRPLGPPAGLSGYAVDGTPADCVKLAVSELMPRPPELVVSGINQGANVGFNLFYSGTVSAATEAALMGLASLAFSYNSHRDQDFSQSAHIAARLVGLYPRLAPDPVVSLNVNLPAVDLAKIKGIRLARQSTARLGEKFLRRTDPRDRVYYWQAGETQSTDGGSDADYPLLNDGYVTITPVRHDLTHEDELRRLGTLTSLLNWPMD